MESLRPAGSNQTSISMLSYYANTIVGNVDHQDVIIGLLVGLLVGIAMLVLLLGILLALFFSRSRAAQVSPIDKIKQPEITRPSDGNMIPLNESCRGEQLLSPLATSYQPPAKRYVQVPPPSDYWQENPASPTANDVEPIKVPQAVQPGH